MRIATFFGLPKVIALAAVALALGGGAYAFTASNTASCTIAAKRAWANGLAGPGPVSIVFTAMSFHCRTTSGELAATRLDVASELNITAHTMTNERRVMTPPPPKTFARRPKQSSRPP